MAQVDGHDQFRHIEGSGLWIDSVCLGDQNAIPDTDGEGVDMIWQGRTHHQYKTLWGRQVCGR